MGNYCKRRMITKQDNMEIDYLKKYSKVCGKLKI